MKILLDSIRVLSGVLMILNLCSIVSLVCLLFVGEWRLVIGGLLFFLFGYFGLTIAGMLSAIIMAPSKYFLVKQKWLLAYILAQLPNLYAGIIVVIWCVLTLHYTVLISNATGTHSVFILILRMIWSYGIAMGVLLCTVAKDTGTNDMNIGPTMIFLFAAIGYVISIFRVTCSDTTTLYSIGLTFLLLLTGALIIHSIFSFFVFREIGLIGKFGQKTVANELLRKQE